MTSGPELFFRYARPPNELGYCGPEDHERIAAMATGDPLPRSEVAMLAEAFSGAWPYLSLLSETWGLDPLDYRVVESYWLGLPNEAGFDVGAWGNSISDRFSRRAGENWQRLSDAVNSDGAPSHAFHVFCVYPWVGLLREGHVEPSLHVLDQCRVSLGSVVGESGGSLIVERSKLTWTDDRLVSASPGAELCANPYGLNARPGDRVATHWGNVCQVLDEKAVSRLEATEAHHLHLANVELFAGRLEPAH